MKTKTEAKRRAILEKAADVFRELGFEKASMSEICARVGGSKATLYNYFASKDELFFETMNHLCEAELEAVHQSIDSAADNIVEVLRHFGERFLSFLYSPAIMAYRHLSIAESGRTELGRLLYERGVMPSQKLVTDFLAAAMAQGRLRQADPVLATKHLYALLESELIDRFLFKLVDAIDEAEIKAVTARALEIFMAAYGAPASAGPVQEGRR